MIIFFFNDTATTEIYTLSLHDALPICLDPDDWRPTRDARANQRPPSAPRTPNTVEQIHVLRRTDRKSTRLNSSHSQISYAVFCLKKKTILLSCLSLHYVNHPHGN